MADHENPSYYDSFRNWIEHYDPVRFSYNPYFSVKIVFFSRNKSVRTMFRFVFSAKRTRPVFENTSIGSSLDDCQIVSHEGHSLEWGLV